MINAICQVKASMFSSFSINLCNLREQWQCHELLQKFAKIKILVLKICVRLEYKRLAFVMLAAYLKFGN